MSWGEPDPPGWGYGYGEALRERDRDRRRGYRFEYAILDEAFESFHVRTDDLGIATTVYIDPSLVFTQPFSIFDLLVMWEILAGADDPYAAAERAVAPAYGGRPCPGNHAALHELVDLVVACGSCGAAL
jgi:hypothetical protein